jgi:LysR family transcriptional regulator, glycine cleavage system transcriptional activator
MQMSLSLLRAFEAAARTASFQKAAIELRLSPSAVSHAVRKLESNLGVSLFERDGRAVRLSADGMALMRHVGPAFADIRRGIDLVSTRGPGLLRVHSAPSFAAQWLTPRLPRFLARHREIEIRLAAGTDYTRFITDEFDADIVYGRPNHDGLIILPLGEEVVTPICIPELAKAIRKPKDLLGQVLIESDNKQIRWTDWFGANHLAAPPPHGVRFDRSFLAIAAAVSGLGVALESTRLAEREMAEGLLVAPLADRAVDVRYVGHFLVFPREAQRRKTLQIFIQWIASELAVPLVTP